MTLQKQRPGGRAGAAGGAAQSAERAAPKPGHSYNITTRPKVQMWPTTPQDLAEAAQVKASAAEYLAECCQAAGDFDGWEFWRRQLLAAQAIYYELTHPPRGEVGQ